MQILTNMAHDYKVGRFHLTFENDGIYCFDTEDSQHLLFGLDISNQEMKELAKALYVGADIKEKAQELFNEEMHAEAEEQFRQELRDLELEVA